MRIDWSQVRYEFSTLAQMPVAPFLQTVLAADIFMIYCGESVEF